MYNHGFKWSTLSMRQKVPAVYHGADAVFNITAQIVNDNLQ